MNGTNAPEALQKLANILVWALVAVYAVGFVWLNWKSGEVALTFWWGREPQPRPAVLMILIGFLCGLLVTYLLSTIGGLRRGAEQRALQRRISGLEAELKRLRNLPIEEDLHAPPAAEPEPAADEAGPA